MHNPFIIITLSSLLFLAGCGQKQAYIDVQGFSFLTNTIVSTTNYDNISVYVIENNRTTSGDIMTALYQAMDSGASQERRAESNITSLQQTYPSIAISEQLVTTFTCDGQDVQGTLVIGTMPTAPEKDPLYFIQHFFIHKGTGYVFTYSSSHQKSATSIGDNWQKIRCPSV